MQIIKTLSTQIEEEIRNAKSYGLQAKAFKGEYPELASTYYKLAEEEMEHVNKLHEAVAVLIRQYRDKNGEPPANMMAVYDYLHERHVESAAEARSVLDMYKR